MNEEKKPRVITRSKSVALKWIWPKIVCFSQIFKPGIGPEEFVEELNKACIKMAEYNDEELFGMKDLLEIMDKDFPQIIQPGMGTEKFIMSGVNAGKKYKEYFPEE